MPYPQAIGLSQEVVLAMWGILWCLACDLGVHPMFALFFFFLGGVIA